MDLPGVQSGRPSGAKVAPSARAASAWAGWPRIATWCPRATRPRTRGYVGAVFPPPSQVTKRNRLLAMVSLLQVSAPPNAAAQPRLEAGAERTLEGVGCSRLFG